MGRGMKGTGKMGCLKGKGCLLLGVGLGEFVGG